ncbi:MAG TPA: type II toxin-antitoxin system VapB family antitoxin [Rhizomicrobium sp.]|jgi:antitoxin VapB|nr:type II toxin-antitoxin system VapB family antitoxin [Rhizomicrobium sp.]
MGINIKNESTEAVVRELAARTGEGLTGAIETAARERLERLGQKPKQTLEEFLAAIRPLQDALKAQQIDPDDKRTARELIDELYDEHGLPK